MKEGDEEWMEDFAMSLFRVGYRSIFILSELFNNLFSEVREDSPLIVFAW